MEMVNRASDFATTPVCQCALLETDFIDLEMKVLLLSQASLRLAARSHLPDA